MKNPKRTTHKGFAVGTILLAIILIAVIVSAIAVSSRGSNATSEREKNTLAANTLVNEATKTIQAWQRYTATGGDPLTLTSINDMIAAGLISNPTFSAQNAFRDFGTIKSIIFDSAAVNMTSGDWALQGPLPGGGGGTATNLVTGNAVRYTWFFVIDVMPDVCYEVNRVAHGVTTANALRGGQMVAGVNLLLFTQSTPVTRRLYVEDNTFRTRAVALGANDITVPPMTPVCFSIFTGSVNAMAFLMPLNY